MLIATSFYGVQGQTVTEISNILNTKPISVTTTNATSNNSNLFSLDLSTTGYRVIAFTVTGTWVATISIQGSNDNFTTVDAIPTYDATSAGATSQTTITVNGTYKFSTVGWRYVRVRTTAYTSGTVASVAYAYLNNLTGNNGAVTLNALPAGTNNIGDVDVLTVPADPFGVNADAASSTGSISAKLRFIAATGIPVTSLPTLANVTTLGTITNVVHVDDNSSSLTVDAPVGTPVFTRLSDGSAALIGQKAMTASLPVVLASDQTSIPVAATLNAETTKVLGVVRNADGAGNLLTTNSTTYTAKFGLDANILGTLGTAFTTPGFVDIKGADGNVFVRQATASNLNATVVGTGTFATQPAGSVAHDGVGTGVNPVLIGGYASAAAPTDVSADGDAVRNWHLRNGAQATVLTAAGALIGGDATNGLDVDVTRMSALVAGSALIGKVGIDQTTVGTTNAVSLAQLGANTIATGNGASSTGVLRVAQVNDGTGVLATVTSLTQFNGNAISTNNGTAGAGVLRTVLASDGTAISTTGFMSVKLDQTTPGTTNGVSLVPTTTGGLTTYHLVSAGSTNATVVKASAGQLYGYYIFNANAAARKLVFHNSASSPTAGASVFFSVVIPASSGANVEFSQGLAFSTGISITTVTGTADSDNTAVASGDLIINLFYK